jgi:hypothetical protein
MSILNLTSPDAGLHQKIYNSVTEISLKFEIPGRCCYTSILKGVVFPKGCLRQKGVNYEQGITFFNLQSLPGYNILHFIYGLFK